MGNEIKLFAENSKEIDERRNARSDVTGTIPSAMNSLSIDFGSDLQEFTKLRIYRINQEEHAPIRRRLSYDSPCIVSYGKIHSTFLLFRLGVTVVYSMNDVIFGGRGVEGTDVLHVFLSRYCRRAVSFFDLRTNR